jgi:hypothetical protein
MVIIFSKLSSSIVNFLGDIYFQDNLEAKVAVAGFSTTCSQKIHNQLVRKELCSQFSSSIWFHISEN